MSLLQLLDLPGIIEGAAQGKGRGRQVIAVARTSDLVLMILDATKKDVHRELLEAELDSVGIRLNQRPPNIYFKARLSNKGIPTFNDTVTLTILSPALKMGPTYLTRGRPRPSVTALAMPQGVTISGALYVLGQQ